MMITPADIETVIQRWKRATRPLKIGDQQYGHRLVRMLEDSKHVDVRRFDDPLEAATFLVLVRLLREVEGS